MQVVGPPHLASYFLSLFFCAKHCSLDLCTGTSRRRGSEGAAAHKADPSFNLGEHLSAVRAAGSNNRSAGGAAEGAAKPSGGASWREIYWDVWGVVSVCVWGCKKTQCWMSLFQDMVNVWGSNTIMLLKCVQLVQGPAPGGAADGAAKPSGDASWREIYFGMCGAWRVGVWGGGSTTK